LRLPFAKYGYRELCLFAAIFVLLAVISCWVFWPLAVVFGLLAAQVVWFFRDPPRTVPQGDGLLVSPADGTVTDITDVDDAEFIGGPARRIGIFLSIFSVHINRAPCAGTVAYIGYHKGKFINALKPESSADNESNSVGLTLTEPAGGKVLVKQISGAIARRIVCDCKTGDSLARGEQFGMIKFGSRTELFIPRDLPFDIAVTIGQKVKAGTTVIGTMGALSGEQRKMNLEHRASS